MEEPGVVEVVPGWSACASSDPNYKVVVLGVCPVLEYPRKQPYVSLHFQISVPHARILVREIQDAIDKMEPPVPQPGDVVLSRRRLAEPWTPGDPGTPDPAQIAYEPRQRVLPDETTPGSSGTPEPASGAQDASVPA